MPPPEAKIALSLRDKKLLATWVNQGAKFGGHWAFETPNQSQLPTLSPSNRKWARNEIDHFIAKRLEREGLKPSPAASKETLIRRAALDLTGLPPSFKDVDTFLADKSPEAYERILDRLLASEH